MHDRRFPNESDAYRQARDELLQAEVDLRAQREKVAAQRRELPVGGEVPTDYAFTTDMSGKPERRRLSELFRPGYDTTVIYSFMYGEQMERACPMCTSMLDSLDGATEHILQRTNLWVAARSPIERIRAHAESRGWNRLQLLSSAGTTYNTDYHAENADGAQLPALNVFVKRDGKVFHQYSTEVLYVDFGKGVNPRHVDLLWPLWNVLDLTPEGRGEWYPSLSYG